MEAKKFTRSFKGVIAGVCGGLGNYFNLDPVLVRVIFLLLFFFKGGGLLLYIILWIVIPRDTQYYTPYQTVPPIPGSLNVAEEENKTTMETPRNKMAAYILGIAFIAFGIMILLHRLFFISLSYLLPIGLMAMGMGMVVAYLFNYKKTEL